MSEGWQSRKDGGELRESYGNCKGKWEAVRTKNSWEQTEATSDKLEPYSATNQCNLNDGVDMQDKLVPFAPELHMPLA